MSNPTIYLAYCPPTANKVTLSTIDAENAPSLLVSYAYAKGWDQDAETVRCRDWILDSGAFTCAAAGKHIDVEAFIEYAKHKKATDPRLSAVFALDVIGDPVVSLRNTERMWDAGIEAIPCFHLGSAWKHLQELQRYPRIAIGGAARRNVSCKAKFAQEVFQRVFPMRIHGFGFGASELVLRFPWHSVDVSSWSSGTRFNRWFSIKQGKRTKSGKQFYVRGGNAHLHAEIETFMRLERAARSKWRSTWRAIEQQ